MTRGWKHVVFFQKMKESSRPRCTALVAAAGSSRRMGGVNKLLEPLDGIPVLARTLTALQLAKRVDEIVVASREEDLLDISDLCRTYGITKCSKVVRAVRAASTQSCWLHWKHRQRVSCWPCRTALDRW